MEGKKILDTWSSPIWCLDIWSSPTNFSWPVVPSRPRQRRSTDKRPRRHGWIPWTENSEQHLLCDLSWQSTQGKCGFEKNILRRGSSSQGSSFWRRCSFWGSSAWRGSSSRGSSSWQEISIIDEDRSMLCCITVCSMRYRALRKRYSTDVPYRIPLYRAVRNAEAYRNRTRLPQVFLPRNTATHTKDISGPNPHPCNQTNVMKSKNAFYSPVNPDDTGLHASCFHGSDEIVQNEVTQFPGRKVSHIRTLRGLNTKFTPFTHRWRDQSINACKDGFAEDYTCSEEGSWREKS